MSDRTYTTEGLDPQFAKNILEQLKAHCLDPAMKQMVSETLDKVKEDKNNIFDNIPTSTIDFNKPIDTEELLEKLEEIDNGFHKRQLQRVKDAKKWWKNLTLEQAENLLLDIEGNPQKFRTMIFDDGFYKYYPPFSIIVLKKALKEFIERKKK